MSAKTPIRTGFNASNVATGLAEYQSGEFIPLSHGGIGAAFSIGSAGQVLKVNSGASALEFGGKKQFVGDHAHVEFIVEIVLCTDGHSKSTCRRVSFAINVGPCPASSPLHVQ